MKILIVGNGASVENYNLYELKEEYLVIGTNHCDKFGLVPDFHVVSDMEYFHNKGDLEIEYEEEGMKELKTIKAKVGFEQLKNGSVWILQTPFSKDIPAEYHKYCHFVDMAEPTVIDEDNNRWYYKELMFRGFDLQKLPPIELDIPEPDFTSNYPWRSFTSTINFYNSMMNFMLPLCIYFPVTEVKVIGIHGDGHVYEESQEEKEKPRNYPSSNTIKMYLEKLQQLRKFLYYVEE